jgi:NTP pyrophosphatase (non-canonical NTP hydrolase)
MPEVMNPNYAPITLDQKLGYLVEECGETLAAVGKSMRWGMESVNPELPPEQQETNKDWLLRELADLKRAISLIEEALTLNPTKPTDVAMPERDA